MVEYRLETTDITAKLLEETIKREIELLGSPYEEVAMRGGEEAALLFKVCNKALEEQCDDAQ